MHELAAPTDAELTELAEPGIETILSDMLAAIPAALEQLDRMETVSSVNGAERGPARTSRRLGPPRDSAVAKDIVPRWERWEIRWMAKDLKAYARQLDFFKIELGAAGGAPHVDYAKNFGKAEPDRREGAPKKEKRLYMTWSDGPLQKFDHALLERAGIDTDRRLVLQFLPRKVEDQLATLEQENAEGHQTQEFLKTTFGVPPGRKKSYEFYVVDQRFRLAQP